MIARGAAFVDAAPLDDSMRIKVFRNIGGSAANFVSIRADAVNNLSDALSSVITIIGARLSERAPTSRLMPDFLLQF